MKKYLLGKYDIKVNTQKYQTLEYQKLYYQVYKKQKVTSGQRNY